jgi:CubicO group peptidase (beta-lactamase class C family)
MTANHRAICFVLGTTLLGATPHPGRAQSAEVDQYIKAEMEKQHIPGLSLVVARDGKIVKQSSYGLASIEFSAPATNATLYQIASATKSFTATAVMMLVEEGKFRTTDSITRLLPGLPEKWNAVTVRQLLSHTSGLPDLLARPGYGPLRWVTRKEALDSLPLQPLAGTPGGQWIYNQTNYLLLQDLVEKYCGESLPQFIKQRIFDPLGMKLTVYDSRTVVPQYATHYEYKDGKLLRVINDAAIYPWLFSAAGIGTTAEELYRFAEALRTRKLLGAAAIEEMWTPTVRNDGKTIIEAGPFKLEYGYGFVVDRTADKRSMGHSGGGNAAFRIFPDDKMVVVVLHNGQTPIPDQLVFGVASKYNPKLTF